MQLSLSTILFIIGYNLFYFFRIYLGLIYHQQNKIIFNTQLEHIGLFFIFLSLVILLFEGKLKSFKPSFGWLVFLIIIYNLVMAVIGYINYGVDNLYFTSVDMYIFFLLSSMLFAADKKNDQVIEYILFLHLFISTILCTSTIIYNGTLDSTSVRYSATYEMWNLMYAWPYFFLVSKTKYFTKLKRVFFLLSLVVFAVVAIVVLKRAPILSMILYIIFAFSLLRPAGTSESIGGNITKKIFQSILGVSLIVVVFYLLGFFDSNRGDYYGFYGLKNRLYHIDRQEKAYTIYDTILENYRFTYEPKAVIEELDLFSVIWGRGFGSTITVPYDISFNSRTGVLHNGLLYLILKGGLLYIILWGLLIYKIAVEFKRQEGNYLKPFYYIVFVGIVSSVMVPLLSLSPAYVLLLISIGKIIRK